MVDLEAWKIRRRNAFINICIGSFLFGVALHIYHPTEYFYFKETMQLKDAEMYYGLSWGVLCGSGVIFALVGSYYYDRTNNIRILYLVLNVLSILGNILYVIYFSPYIVLGGQFLIGMTAARTPGGIGEMVQVYETERYTQLVSINAIFSCLGGVIGPSSTWLFNLVDTEFNGWILDVNNMVGVVMGSLFVLYFILNLFTLHNVALEYNLKKETADKQALLSEEEDEEDEKEKESDNKDNTKRFDNMRFRERYTFTIRALLRNHQAMYLYWLSFFSSFCRASLMMFIPIKSEYYLQWTQTDIAAVSLVSLVAGAFPTAILFSLLTKYVDDFYLLVVSKLTLIAALLSMAAIHYIPDVTLIPVLFYLTGFFTIISATAFHIVSRAMLARLVPYNIQAITDAIRNILFELAYMAAGLLVNLTSPYYGEFTLATTSVTFLGTLYMFCRYRSFMNLKILSLT